MRLFAGTDSDLPARVVSTGHRASTDTLLKEGKQTCVMKLSVHCVDYCIHFTLGYRTSPGLLSSPYLFLIRLCGRRVLYGPLALHLQRVDRGASGTATCSSAAAARRTTEAHRRRRGGRARAGERRRCAAEPIAGLKCGTAAGPGAGRLPEANRRHARCAAAAAARRAAFLQLHSAQQ